MQTVSWNDYAKNSSISYIFISKTWFDAQIITIHGGDEQNLRVFQSLEYCVSPNGNGHHHEPTHNREIPR